MAGEIKSLSIQFQIGYKRWYGPALKTFYLHRQGILGKPKDQDWARLEEHLQDLLAGKEVDAVLLRDFEPVEPPHTLGFPRLPFACKQKRTIWQEHWVLEGYGGLQAHRARHKAFWHNVKNRGNRLKRRFGENWSVETFNKPDQLSRVLGDTESVARKTWQRRLGGESFHSPELAARYHHLLKRGLLEARILYVEGRPAAFLHGVAYKGNFFAEVTGYDPAYTDFGPGTYLTGELIKEFLGREKGGFMDWGVGNSETKVKFCDRFYRAADRYMVAPTPRLMALNTARAACLAMHLFLKKALKKGGLYHRVRSMWRHGGRGEGIANRGNSVTWV